MKEQTKQDVLRGLRAARDKGDVDAVNLWTKLAHHYGATATDVIEASQSEDTALRRMLAKHDGRVPGSSGYVTYLPEVRDIMAEITDLVPVGIKLSPPYPHNPDFLDVQIKIGFSVERSEC